VRWTACGAFSAACCAKGSTRQELFGIRTEVERQKFFAALKLWTVEPLSAVRGMPRTAFETLANVRSAVACCVKW
jgi:hypothetical protein